MTSGITKGVIAAVLLAAPCLQAQPETTADGHHLVCEQAARPEDTERLERCTAALVAASPDDPRTVRAQWTLAVRRRDRVQARALIERARATGVPEPEIAQMTRATDELDPGGWLGLRYWRTGILVLLLIVGVTITLSGRRPPVTP
jgi:hypothetical protein